MHAAAGQDVERGDAFGHLDRVVHRRRQAHHAVADADALRAPGNEGEERLRRAHVRVVGQRGVLDRPDHVEAHVLGEHHLLHDFIEHLVVAGTRGIDGLGFIDQ
ncbi:hypothetical protein D3C81_1988550 [compost metagenome]